MRSRRPGTRWSAEAPKDRGRRNSVYHGPVPSAQGGLKVEWMVLGIVGRVLCLLFALIPRADVAPRGRDSKIEGQGLRETRETNSPVG